MTTPQQSAAREQAESIVLKFTGVAVLTGAVPVPATSLAIVAENAAMVAAVASAMRVPVSLGAVVGSMGALGAANVFGRAVFVEGARALGWFGGPLGVGGVMALGATTAGLQTWTLGQLAISLCANGGAPLQPEVARAVIDAAGESYKSARERAKEEARKE